MNSSPLEFEASVWMALIEDLRRRGGGVRESGAFLVGGMHGGIRQVHTWVPYDELDEDALTEGYIRLGTAAFTKLWAKCNELGTVVVADVHTHPFGPRQSLSDMANPMISQAGHMALIVPRYAQGDVSPSDLSVNIYLGSKRWASHFGRGAATRIRIT
jgi:proteasome lid subunit RPN8/RPN11